MKKQLLVATLALSMSATAPTVQATGIPVVDVASIMQMVIDSLQTGIEFEQQISEARNRLLELKNQGEHYRDMVQGHYNFEDLINDPNLNQFMNLDEWRDIYDDIGELDSLRDKYGLRSDNPSLQAQYDTKLRQLNAQQKYYDATINRNNQLQSLMAQFTSATNPAVKEDLANAITLQQTQIENDKEMMKSLTVLMSEQSQIESEIRERNELDEFLTMPDEFR
ncbi:type IV secretion system protein [uncultured Shewanella sp.]|uniref:type IV secretion system protein n=1 Tax=uncultured Shewanella sp. TaxID=173975 RepID=UPI0026066FEB|nr:type IV secretion system protein [uncultured Shewanella sp.]